MHKKTPEEIAYQLLEHFAFMVPHTSFNLARMTTSTRALIEKVNKYNNWVNNRILPWIPQEAKALANEIQSSARTLNIGIDLSKTPGKQITNLPSLYDRGRYLTWYQKVLTEESARNLSSQIDAVATDIKKYDDYIEQYRKANGPLSGYLCEQLVKQYQHYVVAKELKTGICGSLAFAGVYYLLTQTDYQGNIFLMSGANVDHAFILINCDYDKVPRDDFTFEKLPPDAMIIDSWTRCKYKASDAEEYYKRMPLVRAWWTNPDTPLKFTQGEFISEMNILHAREFLKGFEKYLHPESNSGNYSLRS